MRWSCVGVSWGRVAGFATAAVVLFGLLAPTEAEARRSYSHVKRGSASAGRTGYGPPFAAMVVDARTGRTMYGVSEDELRHPASVTKVMTLYLLFEQIERGALKLDSELKVSKQAAAMPPSKLGLTPGDTIEVEDAIKAIVTRSANDVAAVIAENIAGSEEDFAQRMTRKARQLGMSRTVYKNASGLPDREQVTTARDLVVLGRAIQERFPKLYKYFQTRTFEYADHVIGNHNRLLGRVEGVDGIKTGFTTASGFNLLTSARLDGKHVVGVVLGGKSAASRDATMTNLIRTNLARASASGNASVFADGADKADASDPAQTRLASALDVEVTSSTGEDKPGRALEATSPRPAPAALPVPPPLSPAPAPAKAPAAAVPASVTPPPKPAFAPAETAAASAPLPPNGPKIDGRLPLLPAVPTPPEPSSRPAPVVSAAVTPAAGPAPASPVLPHAAPVRVAAAPDQAAAAVARAPVSPARAAEAQPTREADAKRPPVSPWVIQLSADENEARARELLDEAKARSGRTLARAAPFTEKVVRAGSTLYRARFSGFAEPDSAQEACKALKSYGYQCFATRS